MSDFHGQEPGVEQRSSVKLVRNAKGDPQWELKVVVGEDEVAVERARELAVQMHRAMEAEFGFVGATR